jgi:hypothetical protein
MAQEASNPHCMEMPATEGGRRKWCKEAPESGALMLVVTLCRPNNNAHCCYPTPTSSQAWEA